MGLKRLLIFGLLMCIFLGVIVEATTLYGTVYDLELNEVENALVEIDTAPAQRYLAKDGAYSFEVPKGEYIIKVTYLINELNYTYSEAVVIAQDGSYVFDLFLFPELTEEEELLADTEELTVDDTNGIKTKPNIVLWGGIAIMILIVTLYIVKEFFRLKKQERYDKVDRQIESDYEKLVMELLGKNDGRITQKDLRKEIPLSEAKISLIISELEHKNKIEKIKKGRGNIIVLKR